MPLPPLHVHTLQPERLHDHLYTNSPFNAAVTTLTITASLSGDLSDLDEHVCMLNNTPFFRTGSTRFRNARVVRMRLRSTRDTRFYSLVGVPYRISGVSYPESYPFSSNWRCASLA